MSSSALNESGLENENAMESLRNASPEQIANMLQKSPDQLNIDKSNAKDRGEVMPLSEQHSASERDVFDKFVDLASLFIPGARSGVKKALEDSRRQVANGAEA